MGKNIGKSLEKFFVANFVSFNSDNGMERNF